MHTLLLSGAGQGAAKDVALHKPCWQSTTSGPNNASLAVDGDKATCATTERQKGAKWTLDLGEKHTITSISLDAGMGLYTEPVY